MTSPRAAQRRAERRRRRMAVAIGAVVVVCVVAFGAAAVALFDGGGDDDPAAAPTSSAPAPSTSVVANVPGTTTTTAVPVAAAAETSLAVGTRTETFVDTTRSTSPNGSFGGASTRTLPTRFWYPAQGQAGGEPAADAPADRTHGPYPLVLFAHGYAVDPDFYAPLLARWAAAGYVVAAPEFPILSGSYGGASHVDYEKTFADASFVITQVLGLRKDDPLGGLVDPARIAAAGHSDGEVISFGVGFLECCRDPRVRSVIAMAGDLSNANNSHVRDTGTPILHIMETNDEYDPYQPSIDWDRENLTAPRWMVSLFSSHVPPYTQPGNAAFELTSAITVAYLDGTVKGQTARLDDLAQMIASQPDVATLAR